MTYNLKSLNVASLDFEDIKNSLISFLEVQPGLTDIDFRNQASTANLLINILSTATAYNGVYSQFGFTESFLSTATLLESVISIASNHSVVVPLTKSASVKVSTRAYLQDYQSYSSTATDGSNVNFYVINGTPTTGLTSAEELYLYAGSNVQTFSNYDFVSQSILLPYNIDPDTINFYVIPDSLNKSEKVKWTRVSKGNMTTDANNNYFTVINSGNGYLVTNNFENAATVPTSKSVIVRALTSNGTSGNDAVLSDPNSNFDLIGTPGGGYNVISLDTAKAKLLFELNYDRCVTLNDYKNAILGSGIEGTSDSTLISVRNGDIPGTVNVYVTDISTGSQAALMEYLEAKAVAGIQVVYGI
jgi:hypothetical protein